MKPPIPGVGLAMVVAFVATACASASPAGGGAPGIAHPTGANELLLRVQTVGGFVAPAYALSQVPEFSLYGDGRIITGGPQIAIYPGPALPNLLFTPISEDGIQAILRAARAAGLFGPDRRFVNGAIADAPTTTFTVVAAGRRHVVSAYALGVQAGLLSRQMSEQERRARMSLLAFQTKLSNLAGWLPKSSISQDLPFVPAGIWVFVQSGTPSGQPGLKQPAVNWPLTTPLSAFGTPVRTWPDLRCAAVTGEAATRLLATARRVNQLTPWRSGRATYSLTLRPLLPDEAGCPA